MRLPNDGTMTEDPDIWRTANLLVGQHGEDAALHAARRADELLEDGDADGSAIWGRIPFFERRSDPVRVPERELNDLSSLDRST
jgi:hypothetical protein